jgi:hypothetical protein
MAKSKKKEVVDLRDEDGNVDLKGLSSGHMMHLTNNQRCTWIAPLQVLGTRTYVEGCMVQPGQSIEVDKGLFDLQMRGNRAFQYLIDKGLVIAKKVKNLDMRDLKNVEPVKPPPELTGERQKGRENMKILEQAVTIDVNHTPAK